jgi:hypothetical protein
VNASSIVATDSDVAMRASVSSTCARKAGRAALSSEIRRRSSASVVASSKRPDDSRLRKRPSILASSVSVPSCPLNRTSSSTDVCAIRSASASSVTVSSRSPSSGISWAVTSTGTSMAAASSSD